MHNYSGSRTATWPPNATQISSRIPAKPRCRASPKCACSREWHCQAVLPPHERPAIGALRALGFAGTDAAVIAHAGDGRAGLLAACSSAAAMWVANAATVSPSADTADRRVHSRPRISSPIFIGHSKQRRRRRPARDLRRRAALRRPRPAARGAAIRRRGRGQSRAILGADDEPGVELFVYGRHGYDASGGGRRQLPGAADARSLRGGRAPSRPRAGTHGLRAAKPTPRRCIVQTTPVSRSSPPWIAGRRSQ